MWLIFQLLKNVRSTLLCLSHTGVFTTEKCPHNLILDCTRRQLQLPLLPSSCLFILYQMSVVLQTATFPIDWRSLYLSGTSHQHISCSPAAGSTSKSWFQFPCGHTDGCVSMEILTSQSRRGQSRCPAVWPPHVAQKDLSCWGADRAWTTRPWAGHRADILRSSPGKKKRKVTYQLNS